MSRYRTRSWRGFDPAAAAARVRPVANVRILGLDPGSRRTGFGLIESRGTTLVAIAHGCMNGAHATPAPDFRGVAGPAVRARTRGSGRGARVRQPQRR